MYLVDTNVWLERLLDQEHSDEVGRLLARVTPEQLGITDFALHSIGVVLSRLQRMDVLLRFVQDVLVDAAVVLIRLEPPDLQRLTEVAEQFRLDFDDAYQYTAAEKNGLTIVSFDHDFDRTERGKRTPEEVLGA